MNEFIKYQFNHPLIGLSTFLSNWSTNYQYEIPVFQRNYIWENVTVQRWLDDVYDVLNVKNQIHYMGTLVYSERNESSITKRLVIDGQQRLTTLFLFFYALRNVLEERGEHKEGKRIEDKYLVNSIFENDPNRLKLKPLVSDDDVYRKIVEKEKLTSSDKESNIYKRFEQIREYIMVHKEISIDDILIRMDNIYFMIFKIPNEDNVQRVFESINATGKQLLDSDLIRNFILMQKTNSEEQELVYKNYYKKIEENLLSDAKEILFFFRWWLAIKTGNLINKSDIYFEFCNWYTENVKSIDFYDILKEILEYSKFYYELCFEDINNIDKSIQDNVQDFRNIESDMPKPLLLELYKLYKNGSITNIQLNALIEMIVTYIVRRGLCDLPTSKISRLFPKVLKDLLEDCQQENSFENIEDYLKYHLVNENIPTSMYMPTDSQLQSMIKESMMYKNSYTKIFFEKYETYKSTTKLPVKVLTVEHLMPQDGKKWLKELDITKEEYDRYNYRLGNLTLLSRQDNSKAKNNIFEKKKEIFKTTGQIKLNMDIISKNKWTIKEIEKRTNKLIESIFELYPYFESNRVVDNLIDIKSSIENCEVTAVLYYDSGSVKLLKGTIIDNYRELKDKLTGKNKYKRIFDDFENEDIAIIKNNKVKLVDDYIVRPSKRNNTSLSTTARLFCTHRINGWIFWEELDGKKLKEDKKLEKYIKDDEENDV